MAIIIGGPLNDALFGTGDFDEIYGLGGDDLLVGYGGDDLIFGGDGDDTLQGWDGDDQLYGEAGSDLIYGGGGDDELYGGDGDDYLRPGFGADLIIGGDGIDRAAFYLNPGDPDVGVRVSLRLQGFVQDTGHGLDLLSGIEHLSGTEWADVLEGDDGDNWLWGGLSVVGQIGNDDFIDAGGGDDLVDIGFGVNTAIGGDGQDTISFRFYDDGSGQGVAVSLELQGTTQQTGLSTDKATAHLKEFENLVGSDFADVLTGDAGDNIIGGGLGSDELFGGDGDDLLLGDGRISFSDSKGGGPIALFIDVGDPNGHDTLHGGAGDDEIHGGGGNDNLYGGSGTDRLFGGAGNDHLVATQGDIAPGVEVLDGGSGYDSVAFAGIHDDVSVDLEMLDDQDTGVGVMRFVSIEVLIGGEGDDTFRGDAGDNWFEGMNGHDVLYGRGGDDVLNGWSGNDFIFGGDGNDQLSGGEGADTLMGDAGGDQITGGAGNDQLWGGQGPDMDVFVFMPGSGHDWIRDFNDGVDRIQIYGVSDFSELLITTSSRGRTVVSWDGGASSITLDGITPAQLSAADFMFEGVSAAVGGGEDFVLTKGWIM